MTESLYQYTVPASAHWSFRVRRGTVLTLTDIEGGANAGMLLYNPELLLEKYNAPDTLKCQHTFKLSRGNCLYSDMGRIFCSIIEDSHGWHETVCGNTTKAIVKKKWGERNYQSAYNNWYQNGYDSFLVELAKYGLNAKDMAANINWFSKVTTDDAGNLSLNTQTDKKGAQVSLRFEMDTLVILHTCPHPLSTEQEYPSKPVHCQLTTAAPVTDEDFCLNFRPENRRGFENNKLYYINQ
jgi:urea carboxylase-associated protein 2